MQTNFENGVRVPLIIRAPHAQARAGMRLSQLVESVDLYKTLADLSGLGAAAVEDGVDGYSLLPLLASGGGGALREASRSVFPRCYTALRNATSPCGAFDPCPIADAYCCAQVPREQFDYMGYSIRTDRWRYTEWRAWDGAALRAVWSGAAHAVELYDHAAPPADGPFASEAANVAADPARAATVRQLGAQLRATFAGA